MGKKDRVAEEQTNKPAAKAPMGVLILLSLIFPGAGQLAIGSKVKGWIIISVSVLLLALFFIQLAATIPPVYNALKMGVEPVIDEAYLEKIHNILVTLFVAVIVWFYAIIDAVYFGRRKFLKDQQAGQG